MLKVKVKISYKNNVAFPARRIIFDSQNVSCIRTILFHAALHIMFPEVLMEIENTSCSLDAVGFIMVFFCTRNLVIKWKQWLTSKVRRFLGKKSK